MLTIAQRYNVLGLPTLLVFQNKRLLGAHCGGLSKEALPKTIETILVTANKPLSAFTQEELTARLKEALRPYNIEDVAKLVDAGANLETRV